MRLSSKSGSTEITVEGDDVKACFEQMASAQEVFLNSRCGACDSDATRFVVRENQGFVFHEVRCTDCGAALSFGQKKEDGSLFPKRKNKAGDWLDNGGWTKYRQPEQEPF
jgi:hypothetical protein